MLLSPPFLPSKAANQSESDWINTAMVGGAPGDGSFPVSFNLAWHGGLHLTAPASGNATERVRAIADGTVVFKRVPVQRVTDLAHPLNYRGGWTDNGAVIIRHETSIGEGRNASFVTFYSLYMHLSEISAGVKVGSRICRKAEIGQAGQIYGGLIRKIHFEVVSDDQNTARLFGRQSGDLPLDRNGRSDSVYGEVFFVLPAATPVYDTKPLPQFAVAKRQPPKPTPQSSLPPPIDLEPVHEYGSPVVIGLHYASGIAYLSTLRVDGSAVGTALQEAEAEYDAYADALRISSAFPAAGRPAPCAVLELIKFGRVLNVGTETLTPNDVPHWRRVNYPGGTGWVNLNAAGVTKYSDADFPHWSGWKLIDDSADQDSRCDSAALKAVISPTGVTIDPINAAVLLNDSAIAGKLSKMVCKFPSEWSAGTEEQRWGWLKQKTIENPMAMTEVDFSELKNHIAALTMDLELLRTPLWHWHPVQFVSHFRKCGWLNERELVRCVPATYQTEQGARGTARILASIPNPVAQQRIATRNAAVFMKVCRKYGVDQRQRLAHFLAQIYRESGVLRWDQELASGAEYQGRADLGNTHAGDGIRFKGRGLIQTTGRTNYEKYSQYRGRSGTSAFTLEPNNVLLATDPYSCVDTAGLYWVSRATGRRPANINISRMADQGVAEADLRRVTYNVNGAEDGPWTGLFERRSHLSVLVSVLLDSVSEITPAVERKNV
ncbi:hydroxyethylthiazole kinase [Pseudoduganella sp. LjRoot289]|uniref:M23 family metallopeptidase n=1 Tax=Pseudoduganella sp. LjRoot289 TaxID=3342314 RepID=UPI003ECC969D